MVFLWDERIAGAYDMCHYDQPMEPVPFCAANQTLSQEDRHILVALHSLKGMGRATLIRLDEQRQYRQLSWREIWRLSPEQWQRLGGSQELHAEKKAFEKKISPASFASHLSERNIHSVCCVDQAYSLLLKETTDFPIVLYCLGKIELLHASLPIAFVGSRAMSGYGEMVTEQLVGDLVTAQATIISGFMTGVDIAAHRAAVTRKMGTIGVLGCGFEWSVPSDQEWFRAELLAAGNLFVSEFPPAAPPLPHRFILRNRIIAGLALATVVVEAARESGSLHTARFALDYGRAVCAVPGLISHPFAEGTRQLLREGAAAVGSGEEILQELPPLAGGFMVGSNQPAHAEALRQRIEALSDDTLRQIALAVAAMPQTIDDLIRMLRVTPSRVIAAVTELEFQGYVRKDGDKLLANLCTMGRSFVSAAATTKGRLP